MATENSVRNFLTLTMSVPIRGDARRNVKCSQYFSLAVGKQRVILEIPVSFLFGCFFF